MQRKALEGHTFQMAKILGLCKTSNDTKRLTSTLLNTNIRPPSLYLVMKDHKNVPEGQSIPGRPICGATCSHNSQLSHILSIIVNSMADHYDVGTESDSTEDMIGNINKFNSTKKEGEIEIISMDVKALYPSLNIEEVASTLAQIYEEGDLVIEGVNWEEATKYIAMMLKPEEIERLGFSEIVQERKHRRG